MPATRFPLRLALPGPHPPPHIRIRPSNGEREKFRKKPDLARNLPGVPCVFVGRKRFMGRERVNIMISLKIALVSAAAVGTVTAGGVTYATVGYSQDGPTAAQGQLPSAGSLPAKPALPVPSDCLPTPAVPKLSGQAPAAVPSKVPGAVASCLGKVPTGVPSGVSVPTSAPTSVPTLKVPGLSVPALPRLDCSQVPSAVQVGGSAEQSLSLPNGLHYDSARSLSHTFQGRKICEVGQTWKDRAGQWIKLERFKGEATLNQIRQAIKLPDAQPISVGGSTVWESPLGGGQGSAVIWSPEPGMALFVSASPVYRYRLEDIVTRLQKIGG